MQHVSMTVFVTQSQHVLATKKYVSMSMTVFVTQSRHLLATKQHVSMTVFVSQSQHVFATKQPCEHDFIDLELLPPKLLL